MQGADLLLRHLASLEQVPDVVDHSRPLRRVAQETAGVELIVMEAVDPATTFPAASSTLTTIDGLSAVPTVPLTGGCVVNPSFVAKPAPMATVLLVALVRPLALAVNVYVPVVLNTTLLNVAIPPVAVAVNPPLTPAGVDVMVMLALELVTRLP